MTLEVYSDIRAGDMYGDVEVSGDEDGYTVDKVELVNEPKMGWEAGDRPKVQVTLEAGTAYYFPPVFREAILFWKEMREAYPPFRKNPVPCG